MQFLSSSSETMPGMSTSARGWLLYQQWNMFHSGRHHFTLGCESACSVVLQSSSIILFCWCVPMRVVIAPCPCPLSQPSARGVWYDADKLLRELMSVCLFGCVPYLVRRNVPKWWRPFPLFLFVCVYFTAWECRLQAHEENQENYQTEHWAAYLVGGTERGRGWGLRWGWYGKADTMNSQKLVEQIARRGKKLGFH